MASSDFSRAMANRSLRTIRSELEFLTDSAVLTHDQYSSILSQLPAENSPSARSQPQPVQPVQPVQPAQPAQPSPQPVADPAPAPAPVQSPPAPYSPPTNQFANTSLNEKAGLHNQYSSPPPPPAYAQAPPVLSIASALYAYTPTDPGDLALYPHDRIQVLEHMNNDWWRGRNERTGMEGIFPRSYVNVINEKAPVPPPSSYGNMPLEVSQSGSTPAPVGPDGKHPSKFEEHGKKFGKKMGNAAIFGAGATMGSNIVNSIF
ncbi:SH3 domain protein [Aspergillus sclerotialis]|uniref:SH3 domain protein n=1 Tax=Aspergillus sclerotialis TaxID=2070753 RepID=A0A3A2ZN22_9EURO|nr:SH3 domain protein [Aspergillus sclerotialis]